VPNELAEQKTLYHKKKEVKEEMKERKGSALALLTSLHPLWHVGRKPEE